MPEFHSQVMSNNQAGPSHGLPKYGTPQYGQFPINQQPALPPNGASGQYHQGTPQGSNMALTFVNPTGQQALQENVDLATISLATNLFHNKSYLFGDECKFYRQLLYS